MTYSELMSSRRLFVLAQRVKAEEEQAALRAQEDQKSAAWFNDARNGGGINV